MRKNEMSIDLASAASTRFQGEWARPCGFPRNHAVHAEQKNKRELCCSSFFPRRLAELDAGGLRREWSLAVAPGKVAQDARASVMPQA